MNCGIALILACTSAVFLLYLNLLPGYAGVIYYNECSLQSVNITQVDGGNITETHLSCLYDVIKGNSTIIREYSGIPHIQASSELIGYFTLGYVHAQDRLWQSDRLRRVSRGRLSEIFGSRTLQFDKIMRNYAFEKFAQEELRTLDLSILQKLKVYTYGVNEYVRLNSLPLEYVLLDIGFEPWTVVDTLAITKMLMFHMTYDWSIDILREYLYNSVKNKEVVDHILPFQDKDLWIYNTTLLNNDEIEHLMEKYFDKNQNLRFNSTNSSSYHNNHEMHRLNTENIIKDKRLKYQGTSSSWVVHGNHTESGKPMYVANFHFDLGIPSTLHISELAFDIASSATNTSSI